MTPLGGCAKSIPVHSRNSQSNYLHTAAGRSRVLEEEDLDNAAEDNFVGDPLDSD